MIRHYIGILGILLFSASAAGQDTVFISKKELIDKVGVQSLQALAAKAELESAKADILQTRAMYLPDVTASYTALATNNPLMAFGSKLNQSRVTMEDFNPANLNHPDAIGNFATKLEVQQPLINIDLGYQKKAALEKVKALSLKSDRMVEYLQMEMTRAYLQLQLVYKSIQVLEAAKRTAYVNRKTVSDYYNNGLIQPFVNYNFPGGLYLTSSPIITANWKAESSQRWTVPVGGGVGKIFHLGPLPVNTQLSAYYNVVTPDNGPDWQIRAQVQFMFPK